MKPRRTRHIQPRGVTPVLRAIHEYRRLSTELVEAIAARDAYWAEHHGRPSFDRAHYHGLHARCGLTYRERDAQAFPAGIDPYCGGDK